MLKRILKFLAGGVLAAALFSACFATFDLPELGDKEEYDAQGNRLVTISVPLASAAGRAVTQKVAAANIDFYEVVFQDTSDPAKFYSATGYKGADKAITLRIAPGSYYAVLFAGKKEDGNNAVLLAVDIGTVGGYNGDTAKVPFIIDATGKVTNSETSTHTPISFPLTPLDLNAFTIDGATSNLPNLSFTGAVFTVGRAVATADSPAFSYYSFPTSAAGQTITATISTAAGCYYDGGGTVNTGYVSAIGTVADSDISVVGVPTKVLDENLDPITGFLFALASDPSFDTTPPSAPYYLSNFGFTFDLPTDVEPGVIRLGFDVKVYAFDSDTDHRNAVSTTKAITWHIRDGLDTLKLDDNTDTAGNSGAGILIAYGLTADLLSLPIRTR